MSEPLPRYITVTPEGGSVITIAVPWPQIEAAVRSAGYEIVPAGRPPEYRDHTAQPIAKVMRIVEGEDGLLIEAHPTSRENDKLMRRWGWR